MTSPYITTGGDCSTGLQYVTIIILLVILVLIVKLVFPRVYYKVTAWFEGKEDWTLSPPNLPPPPTPEVP